MKNFIFSILLVLSLNNVTAQTTVPAYFSDNMVLQQQTLVAIWGKDKPATKVIIIGSWGKQSTTTTDEKGHWKLKLQTPVAGGPYNISIKGSKKIDLKNILIGEVWFCSGQSNMVMPVKGLNNQPIIGSNELILHSANDNIRLFNTPQTVSITPLYDTKGNWKPASNENTGNFSAVAYSFAKKINAILNVPIGIIECAWGGSSIESWMDEQSLSGFKNNKIPDTIPTANPQRTPAVMYNAMLYPYIGYTIKGVLWYQGESNINNASEYKDLFTTMITQWRRQWQQGDFPFYFVQIAPYEPVKVNSAFLREAQLQTMLTVKNTGMAVTLDVGEQKVIHPSNKEVVGNRLAYWALAKDYQVKGIACSGPVYKQMEKTKDNKIIVSFDYCDLGLSSFGQPLSDFEIAAEDKVFYPAQARLHTKKGSLIVWNDDVKNPVSVRYAFKSWVVGSLFNTLGLPASSFRTDDW